MNDRQLIAEAECINYFHFLLAFMDKQIKLWKAEYVERYARTIYDFKLREQSNGRTIHELESFIKLNRSKNSVAFVDSLNRLENCQTFLHCLISPISRQLGENQSWDLTD
ncbi:CLUMA_CG013591, isoform A [Clunio marinus]|uniref:CLUMA_CG013591, isoform A n=1 Tax=Clunio marinus TaxID=568069 RepID=A0A1J1IMK5_9DIPT|nr:CLUMA_CG013591, isoform A [Clunio marinus]